MARCSMSRICAVMSSDLMGDMKHVNAMFALRNIVMDFYFSTLIFSVPIFERS